MNFYVNIANVYYIYDFELDEMTLIYPTNVTCTFTRCTCIVTAYQ